MSVHFKLGEHALGAQTSTEMTQDKRPSANWKLQASRCARTISVPLVPLTWAATPLCHHGGGVKQAGLFGVLRGGQPVNVIVGAGSAVAPNEPPPPPCGCFYRVCVAIRRVRA